MTIASMLNAAGYETMGVGKWHLGLGDGRARPTIPRRCGRGRSRSASTITSASRRRSTCRLMCTSGTTASSRRRPRRSRAAPTAGRAATASGGAGRSPRASGTSTSCPSSSARRSPSSTAARRTTTRSSSTSRSRRRIPPGCPSTSTAGRSDAGYYGDFVAQVDATIGRILDALDRTGQAGETLLIVTSDNGAHWPVADIVQYRPPGQRPLAGPEGRHPRGRPPRPLLRPLAGQVEPGSTCDADHLPDRRAAPPSPPRPAASCPTTRPRTAST